MVFFSKLSDAENAALTGIASSVGVNPDSLYKLIDFESRWDPAARNPISGARGLIQFVNSTSREMGFIDADDLYLKNPTRTEQLPLVAQYLYRYAPYTDDQSLAMAVFYPAYRNVPVDTVFPRYVQDQNPGIVTVMDYLSKVYGKNWLPPIAITAGLVLIMIAYILSRKGHL